MQVGSGEEEGEGEGRRSRPTGRGRPTGAAAAEQRGHHRPSVICCAIKRRRRRSRRVREGEGGASSDNGCARNHAALNVRTPLRQTHYCCCGGAAAAAGIRGERSTPSHANFSGIALRTTQAFGQGAPVDSSACEVCVCGFWHSAASTMIHLPFWMAADGEEGK